MPAQGRLIERILLKKYSGGDFIRYKKSQFISYISFMGIIACVVLFIASYFLASREMFEKTGIAVTMLGLILVISLVTVTRGHGERAAMIIAIGSCLLITFSFFFRPPHLASVAMGMYMFQDIAFASLFCGAFVAGGILVVFLGSHLCYFLSISVLTQGVAGETARTGFIHQSVVLITVFITCVLVERFLRRAIEMQHEEAVKNAEQYDKIHNLMGTISQTSDGVSTSIDITNGEIIHLSDSAQSQATAMEELSATMEEISAGVQNVAAATGEQEISINVLKDIIEKLVSSIDKLEKEGQEITRIFESLLIKSKEGERSSAMLDTINSKISDNSEEMQDVVDIMSDFFDRINLLSLNAAIEAARAGDHGRGFAVVADEIGKLADNSSREAERISTLIGKNRADVKSGSDIINGMIAFIKSLVSDIVHVQSGAASVLKAIESQKSISMEMNGQMEAVKTRTDLISTAMREQESAMESCVAAIENITGAVQGMADSTETLRNNSMSLVQLAEDLGRRLSAG